MVTVGEIIAKTNFHDVFSEYKKHYEEAHRRKVMEVFQALSAASPSQTAENMVLFIRAIKENAYGDDIVLDTFDCDDKSILFDVCGIADGEECLYSIASSPYAELLGYYVRDDVLDRFTPAQITAHILWALDWSCIR